MTLLCSVMKTTMLDNAVLCKFKSSDEVKLVMRFGDGDGEMKMKMKGTDER